MIFLENIFYLAGLFNLFKFSNGIEVCYFYPNFPNINQKVDVVCEAGCSSRTYPKTADQACYKSLVSSIRNTGRDLCSLLYSFFIENDGLLVILIILIISLIIYELLSILTKKKRTLYFNEDGQEIIGQDIEHKGEVFVISPQAQKVKQEVLAKLEGEDLPPKYDEVKY